MKKLMNGWLVLSLAILVGCAAAVPPGVGVWNLMMSTPLGDNEVELILNEDGSGMMSAGPLGEAPLDGAMFEGNTIAFSIDLDVQGQAFTLDFTGTVDGDSLEGEFGSDFGAFDASGSRQ